VRRSGCCGSDPGAVIQLAVDGVVSVTRRP
jgi:hypothetical protein